MTEKAVFLNGEDLKQFMLVLHGCGYDQNWAKKFREEHPLFQKVEFLKHDIERTLGPKIIFHVAGELNGKNMLELRKATTVLTKEGILFRPIGHCCDAEMGQPLPHLYLPFTGRAEYWGNTKSSHFPDVEYPYLQITGVEIQ